jgi:hypothetical protein
MLLALAAASCSALPYEFNLAPFYRQRLDPDGTVRELDVLWPLIHYRTTDDGRSDFRLRPFYRRLGGRVVEHEFLWPLGRVATGGEEQKARLFPLVYWLEHTDDEGRADLDWHLFPFLWGGVENGKSYLALFPVFGGIPDFLTYDRFSWILWPLLSTTRKETERSWMLLWFLAGFGTSSRADGPTWQRLWPLWMQSQHPGKYQRFALLWPFLHWGRERLDTGRPLSTFHLWPLFGRIAGGDYLALTTLWPLFQYQREGDQVVKWDLPWPFLRWFRDDREERQIRQWWLWPLVSITRTLHWDSDVYLWPLIWLREFRDPDSVRKDRYFLPLYWDWNTVWDDGSEKGAVRVFPLCGVRWQRDGSSAVRVLDPIPYDGDGRAGYEAHYGFLWTLFAHDAHQNGDARTDWFANLYTSRRQAGRQQSSVPFLFNIETEADGSSVFRLFQFLPLRFGPSAKPDDQVITPSAEIQR